MKPVLRLKTVLTPSCRAIQAISGTQTDAHLRHIPCPGEYRADAEIYCISCRVFAMFLSPLGHPNEGLMDVSPLVQSVEHPVVKVLHIWTGRCLF